MICRILISVGLLVLAIEPLSGQDKNAPAANPPVVLVAARKRLGGKDTAVLALSWEEPLSPVFRQLFRDDVLVFVFPKNAPTWKRI